MTFLSPSEILILPILFYRKCISPFMLPTCRFTPTCSQYAIDALRTHGVLKGLALAVWRILRCQPFSKGGYDPVPEIKKKSLERREAYLQCELRVL